MVSELRDGGGQGQSEGLEGDLCDTAVLLPRLRGARPGAVVLADGFSCRTQIHELDSGGREAMHLAELLAAAAAGAVAAVRAAR